jgi:transcriptional regulator
MYVPNQYRETDRNEIIRFVRDHHFGILVCPSETQLMATHIPFLLQSDDTTITLFSHISRANEQRRMIGTSAEFLAIFHGPHAYISPAWYTQPNVPTWNYMAVHLYGTTRLIEGDELTALMRTTMDSHEAGIEGGLHFDKLPEKMLETDMRGIAGFSLTVTRIDAVKKLSQNRDRQSRENIIDQLSKSTDPDAVETSRHMKQNEE